MDQRMKQFIAIFAFLSLCACEVLPAAPMETLPSPLSEPTQKPLPSMAAREIIPSPTDMDLPYNPVTESSEYCQPPYAFLTLEESTGLSEDDIVHKLVELWLLRYENPDAHPYCRIDGYTIDEIHEDPDIAYKSLTPKSDLMRVVDFSVKLIQIPNDWLSFAGEVDRQNWFHTSHYVTVFERDTGYEMRFAYP
jgi:hypothetical protein